MALRYATRGMLGALVVLFCGHQVAAKADNASVESHIKKAFPNATIVSTKTALKHFSKIYEVKLNDSGKEMEVALAPDGTILKVETQITAQDLPKAVADAAAQIAKGGKIVEVEMIERRGTLRSGKAHSLDKPETYFEIEYKGTLGIKSEATLNPDGTRRVHKGAATSDNAPVESHIKKAFPSATIVSTKTALKHFSKIYEAKLNDGGKELEVALAPDGTILKVETKMAPRDLPKPVADAASEIVKAGKIIEVEKIERRGTVRSGKAQSLDKPEVYFEIEYSGTLGIKSEAKLNPDGTRRTHKRSG